MMFGQPRFAAVNSRINQRIDDVGTLIVVHRGTSSGSIVENTPAAVTTAVTSGGDVVEIDTISSADGDFFVFHDGNESRLLGITTDIRRLTAAEVRAQRYVHVDRPAKPVRVAGLRELLTGMPEGTLINLDRSWAWWESLLPELDLLQIPGQLLLKCHADDVDRVAVLRAHPVKYPFLPICSTVEQAFTHLGDPDLNTIGVELLARDSASPFLDRRIIADLRSRGALVLVNAEVLTTGTDLFAGYDDERSILGSPDEGWGRLMDLGVNAIQTDWPWLLRDYRSARQRAMVEA